MWSDNVIRLFRQVIDDDGPVTEYTDHRLTELLLTAAYFVNNDLNFGFSINIGAGTVSPNPDSNESFTTLVLLKAYCVLMNSELKTQSRMGVVIKDGPSTIDGKSGLEAKRQLAEEACKAYGDAELEYKYKGVVGKAIVGPGNFFVSGRPVHPRYVRG